MFEIITDIILILILPFLFIGVINKTKAFWGGRKGPSILQSFYDCIRLFKKGQVISNTASFVFCMYPFVVLGTTFFAALLVPFAFSTAIININGGFILFAYVLGLGKFMSLIGALDVGSSFEGMGASREAAFSAMVEPAFFIVMASLAAMTGNFSFGSISSLMTHAGSLGYLMIILAAITFFIIILVEGCRVPVDDPNTHLELTMIHEVMILDNSGADLAMLTYSSALKMVIFASLIANVILPDDLFFTHSLIYYLLIVFVIALLVGTLESAIARLRMSRVLDFIFIMSSIGLTILALVAVSLFS
ncbi:MAG: NADH-quinone oxidoreductase subunit H [Lentisphaerota bacterium]